MFANISQRRSSQQMELRDKEIRITAQCCVCCETGNVDTCVVWKAILHLNLLTCPEIISNNKIVNENVSPYLVKPILRTRFCDLLETVVKLVSCMYCICLLQQPHLCQC
jgi:hypothetical protein